MFLKMNCSLIVSEILKHFKEWVWVDKSGFPEGVNLTEVSAWKETDPCAKKDLA